MGSDRTQELTLALVLALQLAMPAKAQEAGWHYSPLAGEGDRASLGCALDSTADSFACIAVRCEDDFSTGVHILTSRTQGDAGVWWITVDKETRSFTAQASENAAGAVDPYGARLVGNVSWVLDNLRNGAVAYLEPGDGSPMPANHIPLDGSLYAITAALAYCAPRTAPPGEPNAEAGV